MAVVTDTTITDILSRLGCCFEEALGREVCIRTGDAVTLWASTTKDECCAGAAWVRVVTFYPGFPAQDAVSTGCWPPLWSLVVELGAARCALTPDAQHIPTCDQHNDLSVSVLDDATAMLCALACFTRGEDEGEGRDYVVGPWLPAPNEGRCAGGSMTVTVAYSPCLDCSEVS